MYKRFNNPECVTESSPTINGSIIIGSIQSPSVRDSYITDSVFSNSTDNCYIKDDVFNTVVIGHNVSATECDKIYIGNTVWDNKKDPSDPQINVIDIIRKLEEQVTDLQSEVALLREMITWHPNNVGSMSQLKEHFENLAHSQNN